MNIERRTKIQRELFLSELSDYHVFKKLSENEKDKRLKAVLERLARMEQKHMKIWGRMLKKEKNFQLGGLSTLIKIRIFWLVITRKVLGVAFVSKLLGEKELEALKEYANILKDISLSREERRNINMIMADERENEQSLQRNIHQYEGKLNYLRSIILGLNDGLVEVLAVVTGLAAVASTGLIVAIGGIIVGASGTLSMAGGTYLSSKSHSLVEEAIKENVEKDTTPSKEALYTGVYYLIGAFIATLPFIIGLSGIRGTLWAIILVSIALTVSSVVIAIVSGTEIKKRVFESIAISLGAAFATILLGSIIKFYFGITI